MYKVPRFAEVLQYNREAHKDGMISTQDEAFLLGHVSALSPIDEASANPMLPCFLSNDE